MKKNNKKPNDFMSNNWSKFILAGLIGFSVVYMFWYNGGAGSDIQTAFGRPGTMSYSEFLKCLSEGSVKDLVIDKSGVVSGLLTGSAMGVDKDLKFKANVPNSEMLWKKLDESGVKYDVAETESSSGMSILYWIIFLIIFFLIIFLIMQLISFLRGFGSGSGPSSSRSVFGGIGKSKARFYPAGTIGVKFDDVAGANEVKDELKDIVEFLKNPDKFGRLGAKIPRGVLLSGQPGNGKTLLAKAIAGEAICPFFSINGSDFIEVFVGVGAARVRDLFKEARRNAPSIIFIDEIDAVGKQRGSGMGGGNDEREQTLNQILAEMDGFDTEAGEVIVIAATNRSDVLDPALTRPGRFDRKVEVPPPDINTREKILKIHARPIKLSTAVDLRVVAKGTTGFSGADLANLLNEAALLASKENRNEVTMSDVEHAKDRKIMGSKNMSLIRTDSERLSTSYHEAGHALCDIFLLPQPNAFYKVTILSRGGTLGSTHSLPEGDSKDYTVEQAENYIAACLGGMAAEELVYGTHGRGVSSDLQNANNIVRSMISDTGMSKLGPMTFNLYSSGYSREIQHSQAYLEKIDSEIDRIISTCYKKAYNTLLEKREYLDKLAKSLLERETLSADEVYQLLEIPAPTTVERFPITRN